MQFEPVWVSNMEHVRMFNKVAEQASIFQRLQRNCPHFEGYTYHRAARNKCEPVAFTSRGRLEVDDWGIRFEQFDTEEAHWERLKLELRFGLPWDMVGTIQRFDHACPTHRWCSSLWTRIKSKAEQPELQDFLICLGRTNGSAPNDHKQGMLLDTTRGELRKFWSSRSTIGQ